MPQKIEAIDMAEVTIVVVTMVEVHSNSSIEQEQVIVQNDGI